MRYFKLRLTIPKGEQLFETDYQVNQFDFFFRNLASIMVQSKLFREGEQYDARIIPRIDQNPSFDRHVVIKGSEISDNGKQGFLGILFENTEPPLENVTYLTAQIRSIESNIAYRFDCRLYDFISLILRNSALVLLNEKLLKEGEHFKFQVSAHDQGRARADAEVLMKTMEVTNSTLQKKQNPEVTISSDNAARHQDGIDTPSSDPAYGDVSTPILKPPEKPEDDLNIVIESVEELIKPVPKSMSTYVDKEINGTISDLDLPIFIKRCAMQKAHKAADVSMQVDEEVGGFLVGNVYKDPETDRLFVDISEVVEADKAHGTYVSLNFNYESWRQVLDRIDREFPNKYPIGWYHTHLISQALVFPVKGTEDEYIAKYDPFFSHPDHFIHGNFFPDPWHVALVMDLLCKQDVFFAWRDGQITKAQGFYLYGE
jgi:hypothetical protein